MEHTPKDQAAWNALAMLAFIIVFLGSVLAVGPWNLRELYHLAFFDLTILGLATLRIIRLITFDKIFGFIRQWFLDEKDGTWHKPAGGFRRLMAELIECIWCTGLWAALAVTVLYLLFPLGRFFVLVLAVAALGTLLQNVSKALAK
jgi:hypothetical protein